MSDRRLSEALAAIDQANSQDPVTVMVDGVERPKELVHAERMTSWLERLDPDPEDTQRLAARAHHLRRWSIPRSDYPEGRAGYLRWRSTLNKQHASEVTAIMTAAGYSTEACERVQQIILKQGRATDPAVQTHEDALCLTFLELQSAQLTDELGHDKMVDVVTKTLPKMSERAIAVAADLDLAPGVRAVLAEAVTALAGGR